MNLYFYILSHCKIRMMDNLKPSIYYVAKQTAIYQGTMIFICLHTAPAKLYGSFPLILFFKSQNWLCKSELKLPILTYKSLFHEYTMEWATSFQRLMWQAQGLQKYGTPPQNIDYDC